MDRQRPPDAPDLVDRLGEEPVQEPGKGDVERTARHAKEVDGAEDGAAQKRDRPRLASFGCGACTGLVTTHSLRGLPVIAELRDTRIGERMMDRFPVWATRTQAWCPVASRRSTQPLCLLAAAENRGLRERPSGR